MTKTKQWKRPPLVGGCSAGGWPQWLLVRAEVQHSWPLAGVMLGSAWSSLANHCKGERRVVGVAAL